MIKPAPSRRAFLRGDWLRRPAAAKTSAAGTAPAGVTVLPHACLAYQGVMCDLCATACPPKALVIQRGRPTVRPGLCDGCGDCTRVCPAPGGGLLVPAAGPRPRRR